MKKVFKAFTIFIAIIALTAINFQSVSQDLPDGEFNRKFVDQWVGVDGIGPDGEPVVIYIRDINCDNPGTDCMSITITPE